MPPAPSRAWPQPIKSALLHAISLASVALTAARGRTARRNRLRAELDQAHTEIALLREELAIKDGRWARSRTRRRPHYLPIQRMRILQLRAARGWTLERTASRFLVDLQTMSNWMRRLDESGGGHELVRTVEPVNRYPDFVRHLVRQLRRLLPTMGCERMARVLARAGLRLGASTIRRMTREQGSPPEDEPVESARTRRRVVARYPGHTWHVDLTVVPTRAGFWVPWFPFCLPQRWPFCWWVAVAVDQVSRAVVGFAVFEAAPTSGEVQRFLGRAARSVGSTPKYVVTDKGSQFRSASFKSWCKRRGIRPRYGRVGQPASIAIVERFIRSMKDECTRLVLVPLTLASMRRELGLYVGWYNSVRPHSTLEGRTPAEVFAGRPRKPRRLEPRARWPHRAGPRRRAPDRFVLDVAFVEGREHLPVVDLRRAA